LRRRRSHQEEEDVEIMNGLAFRVRGIASYNQMGHNQNPNHGNETRFRRSVSLGAETCQQSNQAGTLEARRSGLAPIPSSPLTKHPAGDFSSFLQRPVGFRRVFSAGPGSPPIRHEIHQQVEQDNEVEMMRPSPSILRTYSLRRRSSSVSCRGKSDQTEEEQIC
jgi:hypothetical protein